METTRLEFERATVVKRVGSQQEDQRPEPSLDTNYR